ncbi:MAG: tRNA pseudouridine(13) synthase TruD [Deltaproteobacteria bacterium]|nr:tRNA pseudouridine(13) synthase TruD [Deltaproteobacteria bacterium]
MPTWITADLPGSSGRLSDAPDDFVVDELLAYSASGTGEHLYLHFEKAGLTTPEAVHRIAERLGARAREAGFAGLKDKNARTRQWVSFPWPIKRALPDPASLSDPAGATGVRVQTVTRHENKIRRGHAKQNRFTITIRDVPDGGTARAEATLDALLRLGAPNAFGPQRFGIEADNAARALRWIRGEERPAGPPRIRTLVLSALQSELFNRVLDRRIQDRSLGRAILGDVMKKHDTGGLFDVTDTEAEQPRVDALAISPTGPLPGEKLRAASGAIADLEAAVVADLGIQPHELERLGPGTRRELRYPLGPDTSLTPLDGAYRLELTLPGGAYATVILAELIKPVSRIVARQTDLDA